MTDDDQPDITFCRAAVATVVADHLGKAVTIVRQMGLTDGTAEDIVQQCLIELIRTWEREGALRNPEFLLFATARRRTIDEFRRRGRTKTALIDNADLAELTAEQVKDMPEFLPGIDGLFTTTNVIMALRELPVRQQEILLLRFGLELDIKTVAAFMACTISDVKNAQARGLNKLRKSPHLDGYPTLPEVHQ
ncbi:RNA polymerase sigma factor [Amycolatopsis sp. lyj-23]|uniref:RNA polymerase sigma factor n=1 Tax=Amycolatopsis sp. lyj-23 TaxID=2789283 RepID=UPI00397BC4A2